MDPFSRSHEGTGGSFVVTFHRSGFSQDMRHHILSTPGSDGGLLRVSELHTADNIGSPLYDTDAIVGTEHSVATSFLEGSGMLILFV